MEQPSVLYTLMGEFNPRMTQAGSSGDLVCNLAHELRQPLSVIESAAYLAQLILERGDARVVEQLEKIQNTVHEINAVLCDLVVHQNAVAGGNPLSLSQHVSDAVTDMRARDGVVVDWTEPVGATLVKLTASQAVHLARNVLNVFAHLCGRLHPVHIRLNCDGGVASLECATRTIESLWRRGQELFTPFTPLVPGEMGLALATVRRIAEVNGGSARIDLSDHCDVKLLVTLPAC